MKVLYGRLLVPPRRLLGLFIIRVHKKNAVNGVWWKSSANRLSEVSRTTHGLDRRPGLAQRATTQPINNSTLSYTHCNITGAQLKYWLGGVWRVTQCDELQLQTRVAEESRARIRSDFRVSDPAHGATHVRTGRKTIRQHIDSSVSLQTPVDLRLTVAGCARLHASIRVAASDST